MKKLILSTLLLVSLPVFSSRPEITTDDSKQIISKIKEVEIENIIKDTAEFKPCREKYEKDKNLDGAVKCFRDILSKADKTKLQKLSESLNLQHYGLVKSKNINDIQDYLTDRMYQALTGVDPKEKDKQKAIDNLKFGKKKLIDQKVFLELYKTQLGKNALFEISRFCFEDLRLNDGNAKEKTSFLEHWGSNLSALDLNNLSRLDDSGNPKFGASFSEPKDKEKLYQEILKSMGTGNDKTQEFLAGFFSQCGLLIKPLCDEFKNKKFQKDNETTQVDIADNSGSTKGAAACLSLGRIQEYKSALANADKILKYFDSEMASNPKGVNLLISAMEGRVIRHFGDGSDPNEATIDELTNHTTKDIIEGGYTQNELAAERAKECEQRPELERCKDFIYEDGALDKVKSKIEIEMTLQREVELERVRQLKKEDDMSLAKYLEEKGFYDLLENDEYKKMDIAKLEQAIGDSFEAKKRATLLEINERLGSRQMKDNKDLQKADIKSLTQETKEERARLAQVVLFNNIITSHLALKKEIGPNKYEDVGRNVGAWRKEEADLLAGKVDQSLFENLKAPDDSGGGIKEASVANFEILDDILGKNKAE
jgi:hypothetical protein